MNDNTGSVRDILTVLFKHKQKIIITFFAVVAAVTIGTFLISPTYEAKSSLLVKFGREYLYTPEVGEGRPTPMASGQEELLNSEVQILMNHDIIGKVLASLGIQNVYPGLSAFSGVAKTDAAINQFKRSLIVEPVKKSNVIQVSFQHHNPEICAKAVNLLVDNFREKHLQIYADPKSSFLAEQLSGYREKLTQAEGKLEGFKQRYGVYSLDEQRGMLLKQRLEADSSDKDAENRMGEIARKIASLQSQMRTIERNVPVSSEEPRFRVVDDANAHLLTLRMKEQELLEKYKEDNRLVVNVRKEIAILENFLKKEKQNQVPKIITGKNPVYDDAEREIVKAKGDLAALESRRSSLKVQMSLIERGLREPGCPEHGAVHLEARRRGQREELPDIQGKGRRGPHSGCHEPAEDGERLRHPGSLRPHRAHKAPHGIQLHARPGNRLHIRARPGFLLRVCRPAPLDPPDS